MAAVAPSMREPVSCRSAMVSGGGMAPGPSGGGPNGYSPHQAFLPPTVTTAPPTYVQGTASYAGAPSPSYVNGGGNNGQPLTAGMPDPAAVERQKAGYMKSLEEQERQNQNALDTQKKQQLDYIYSQADQQKKQLFMQIDQQVKTQEMALTQQYNEQLLQLNQQYHQQKASLETQAMQLTMEYQQRSMQDEMMKKQLQLQKEQYEVQQRFHADMKKLQTNNPQAPASYMPPPMTPNSFAGPPPAAMPGYAPMGSQPSFSPAPLQAASSYAVTPMQHHHPSANMPTLQPSEPCGSCSTPVPVAGGMPPNTQVYTNAAPGTTYNGSAPNGTVYSANGMSTLPQGRSFESVYPGGCGPGVTGGPSAPGPMHSMPTASYA